MSGIFGCFSPIQNHEKIISLAKKIDYTIKEVKANELSLIWNLDLKTLDKNEIDIKYEKNGYIIFSGEIFDENIPDPKRYILELYKNGDFEKLKDINGSFIAAIYDEKNEKLILINDRFGSIKLFYYYDKNHLFFSPKVSTLMKLVENKKIRKDGLIDFLIFGFFLENKTFDENIFQLSPASILEITNNKMTVKKYWMYQCDGDYDLRDKDALINELGTRFRKAVDIRVKKKEKIIVQISGGLDSRAILAAALQSTQKEKILLYTFGEEGSYDFDIGTNIAKMLEVQQIALHPIKESFAEQYLNSFSDGEGMIDATPYFPLQMNIPLRQFSNNIYNGFMGGEIMGPLIFAKIKNIKLHTDVQYEKAKTILLNHHKINDIGTVENLFNKSYLNHMPILTSFEKSIKDLKGFSSKEFPNYCARWLYLNESDKYTSFCNFRYKNQFYYYAPFLDYDVVDFMLQIPPEFRTNKKLYKRMLLKNYSELFHFPTKNTLGLTLQTNHFILFIKRVLAFIQRKFNTLLNYTGRPNFFFNKNENYINYDDLLRTNKEYQLYVKTMLDKVKKREFFDATSIDSLWDSHLKGKKNYARLFGLLVTVELILEEYYESSLR